MPDWSRSMQQTFEYYIVDPGTWQDKRKIDTITGSSIDRDYESETLGSASFNIMETVGECYIRTYLITVQDGITEKHPLGTHLVQTPSSSYDGKVRSVSMDAYTPLLELKEKPTPLGYSVLKELNIMDTAYSIIRTNVRAPVVKPYCTETLFNNFIANQDDTWLSFTRDLIAKAKYTYDIDELGRILFAPKQKVESMQPRWTFDDSNSSILYPDITMDHDLYGIPNVVEVIYSSGMYTYYGKAINDDPNSPTSIQNRGREILYRDTQPSIGGIPSDNQMSIYAENLLKELSTVSYTLSYSHGYCPVRLGDCVRLNYERAGITDIKARVISQKIDCEPGCKVTEKATFTSNLWR